MHKVRKGNICHMPTMGPQFSLCFREVGLCLLLYALVREDLIRSHKCAGWSESFFPAGKIWAFFSCCASIYTVSHYENTPIQIYRNFTTKEKENFQIKNSDNFHISAQNIDCGYSLEPPRRGGSNQYPQSMFFWQNKKNNVLPCKPQFYYIKEGFKGVKLYRRVFVMIT